jgi:glucose dehydrogenase
MHSRVHSLTLIACAMVLAGHHQILGMGGDGSNFGPWLESRDPATGELQWRWYTTPRPGESGMDSWPDPESASKAGGMPWQQVTFDPELDLIYVPTANPVPVFNGRGRRSAEAFDDSDVVQLYTEAVKWRLASR